MIFEAHVGGAQQAKSNALTFSRHDKLTIVVDASNGTITVIGAASGDGLGPSGTAWMIADGTLRVGGDVSGTSELFGRLSEPRAA